MKIIALLSALLLLNACVPTMDLNATTVINGKINLPQGDEREGTLCIVYRYSVIYRSEEESNPIEGSKCQLVIVHDDGSYSSTFFLAGRIFNAKKIKMLEAKSITFQTVSAEAKGFELAEGYHFENIYPGKIVDFSKVTSAELNVKVEHDKAKLVPVASFPAIVEGCETLKNVDNRLYCIEKKIDSKVASVCSDAKIDYEKQCLQASLR